jgi:type II secretory pathway pseudopilin PulG
MLNKQNFYSKGAMFGLDARIALVIIATLSLLTYPAVMNIIENSQAKAIIASSKNITLAIENYVIDINSIPASIDNLFTTAPTDTDHAALWNGPYLQGEKTTTLMPSLTWTLEDDDCSSTTTASRYCTYRVSYVYCDQSEDIYYALSKYYDNASQVLSYNPTGECITVNYGYADNSGAKSYINFKVKEKP